MNATVGKLTTQQTNTYHWQELTTEAYNYLLAMTVKQADNIHKIAFNKIDTCIFCCTEGKVWQLQRVSVQCSG